MPPFSILFSGANLFNEPPSNIVNAYNIQTFCRLVSARFPTIIPVTFIWQSHPPTPLPHGVLLGIFGEGVRVGSYFRPKYVFFRYPCSNRASKIGTHSHPQLPLGPLGYSSR